jgi:hypothetical protein
MSQHNIRFGTPVSKTASGTTVALATLTTATNTTYYITDITGSGDLTTGTITVYGGATGTTVLWVDTIGSVPYRMNFTSPLKGNLGVSMGVQVGGTTVAYANVSGFSLP